MGIVEGGGGGGGGVFFSSRRRHTRLQGDWSSDGCSSDLVKPLSLEVFSDEFSEMKRQGLKINAWGKNVYVKIPITNPTLMRKAGLTDFEAFARDVLQTITVKPLSLEVFFDEFSEMKRQGLKINAWGKNVYVKIPVTNTRNESSLPLIKELASEGVKLNVTAILTLDQVKGVAAVLNPNVPAVVSVFAGRI